MAYSLAPQRPFPGALQDLLLVWLNLVYPSDEARHNAISPETVVFAGDSAGGNLVLAMIQAVLRIRAMDDYAGVSFNGEIVEVNIVSDSLITVQTNNRSNLAAPSSWRNSPLYVRRSVYEPPFMDQERRYRRPRHYSTSYRRSTARRRSLANITTTRRSLLRSLGLATSISLPLTSRKLVRLSPNVYRYR